VLLGLTLVACAGDSDPKRDPAPRTDVRSSTDRSSSTTSSAPATEGRRTSIERIVDGDTVVVVGNETVRLIGIDTPETRDPRRPVQCFGAEATRHITALIPPGTDVVLVRDVSATDRFGRTLSYVYRASDQTFVNAEMVRAGFAAAATFPPDVAHAEEFVRLEREARDAGRGLWSACGSLGVPVRT
jgi:micrococcal nuclease